MGIDARKIAAVEPSSYREVTRSWNIANASLIGGAGVGAGRVSVEQLDPIFFDHRIRQNLMRNGLQIFDRLLARNAVGDGELEDFALPHVRDGRITQAMQCGANGLALWIENRCLGRNNYARFHWEDRLSHAAGLDMTEGAKSGCARPAAHNVPAGRVANPPQDAILPHVQGVKRPSKSRPPLRLRQARDSRKRRL